MSGTGNIDFFKPACQAVRHYALEKLDNGGG